MSNQSVDKSAKDFGFRIAKKVIQMPQKHIFEAVVMIDTDLSFIDSPLL